MQEKMIGTIGSGRVLHVLLPYDGGGYRAVCGATGRYGAEPIRPYDYSRPANAQVSCRRCAGDDAAVAETAELDPGDPAEAAELTRRARETESDDPVSRVIGLTVPITTPQVGTVYGSISDATVIGDEIEISDISAGWAPTWIAVASLPSAALIVIATNEAPSLRVPCSRYGSIAADCAPVAVAVARIMARETGEPMTLADLDHAMSLVVNDHDDVASLIRSYGSDGERAVIEDVIADELEAEARELGRDAASAAASWAVDGNTSPDAIRRTLDLLEDGDPAAWDRLPREPDLSGEWADDPTPASLVRELGEDPDRLDPETVSAVADAYALGVEERFLDACETELRRWIADER